MTQKKQVLCDLRVLFSISNCQTPELDSEDYDSLGGFIIEHLDRLPVAGDEVITEEGIRLIVEKLDKNRIEKVHVYLPEKSLEPQENMES